MVIHSLLQKLSDDGFGTVGEDLQIGVLPVDGNGDARNGICIVPRGFPVSRIQIEVQTFDLYTRNTNPLTALQKSQELLEYLRDSFSEVCTLPPLAGVTTEEYENVTITPVASPEWVGTDENGGTSYVISGEVRYSQNQND